MHVRTCVLGDGTFHVQPSCHWGAGTGQVMELEQGTYVENELI
ncbi:MAG TPA: hypothetical protein VFC84_07510 [Desulfosporosinus sp.]|nr:hypothetical protein [Desulfosporosinus sp.]